MLCCASRLLCLTEPHSTGASQQAKHLGPATHPCIFRVSRSQDALTWGLWGGLRAASAHAGQSGSPLPNFGRLRAGQCVDFSACGSLQGGLGACLMHPCNTWPLVLSSCFLLTEVVGCTELGLSWFTK